MKKLLISACLLGVPCRYDGRARLCAAAQALAGHYTLVPVCPEVLGGLSTPRPPAEIRGGRLVTENGGDVTEAYRRGAETALRIARENGCIAAVLKERSPSCGKGRIYDGSFTGTLTGGDGVTARLLTENGIPVFGESETGRLLQEEEPDGRGQRPGFPPCRPETR